MRRIPLRLVPLILIFSTLPAAAQPRAKPMFVLVIPGLTAADIRAPESQELAQLARDGAVGWMNVRTARVPGHERQPDSEEAIYASLGAGSRAAASAPIPAINEQTVIHLQEENRRLDHSVRIGALGDVLHQAGVATAIIGNEDDTSPRRAAGLVATDSRGRIDHGVSGPETNDRNAAMPYGWLSNWSGRLWNEHSLFQVWVFGDLARSTRYSPLCLPTAAHNQRAWILRHLDEALHEMTAWVREEHGRMVLIGPPVSTESLAERLAPVLVFGEGVKSGMVTSGSTHRPGLVTVADFLPTVCDWFQLRMPVGMVGRPITISESSLSSRTWSDLYEELTTRAHQQSVFGGLPTVQLLLVASVMALGWPKPAGVPRWSPALERLQWALPLAILAIPVVCLLMPQVAHAIIWQDAVLLAGALLATVLIGWRKTALVRPIGLALLAILAIMPAIDLVSGQYLLMNAWMSYSVTEGARFYGIGNEYAAATLAAGFMLALLAPFSRGGLIVVLSAIALTSLLIGLPFAGANAGCLLAGSLGVGATVVVVYRGGLRARDVILLLAAGLAVAVCLLLVDAARSADQQTHLGRAYSEGLIAIARRKLALNLHLLTHSAWMPPLIVAYAGLLMELRKRESIFSRVIAADGTARAVATGFCVCVIVLFAANDSGVVAAAQAVLIAWAAVQLLDASGTRTQSPGSVEQASG